MIVFFRAVRENWDVRLVSRGLVARAIGVVVSFGYEEVGGQVVGL